MHVTSHLQSYEVGLYLSVADFGLSVADFGAIHEHKPKISLDQKSSYCIVGSYRRRCDAWWRNGMFSPLPLPKLVLGERMARGFVLF